MKFLIIVPDGSADEPIDSLGGKTPLESAQLTCMNDLASRGMIGTARTVPEGVLPGSDSANLSVMGYDPRIYLTGRSPLEAAAIGVSMEEGDVAFRVNFVTLDPAGKENYEEFQIVDHAAGDISTEDSKVLLEVIRQAFSAEKQSFHPGAGYRHCMLLEKGHEKAHTDYSCIPPHDILGKQIEQYLPKGRDAEFLIDMMKKSYELLKEHPMNQERIANGQNPANSIWIWGQGTKPMLPNLNEKYQVDGVVISAVDLIRGIGTFAGLDILQVEGATGTLHTNYEGKVEAAIKAYESGKNFVYMHIEGTDECSHQGNLEGKIQCIEYIDQRIAKPLYDYLKSTGEDFRILIIPDHRTPLSIRTHTDDPVPFVLYDSQKDCTVDFEKNFNEKSASKAQNHMEEGHRLADQFFARGDSPCVSNKVIL